MKDDQALFRAFDSKDANAVRQAVLDHFAIGGAEFIEHPLGFYFSRLTANETISIRLHYWAVACRDSGTALSPYHDHIWNLCSCVLHGSISNTIIDVIEDSRGAYRMADIAQADAVDAVKPSSVRVSVQVRDRKKYFAGEFYEISAGTFHFSELDPMVNAITVVRAETVSSKQPRTLVPDGTELYAPKRMAVANSRVLTAELLRLLSRRNDLLDS